MPLIALRVQYSSMSKKRQAVFCRPRYLNLKYFCFDNK